MPTTKITQKPTTQSTTTPTIPTTQKSTKPSTKSVPKTTLAQDTVMPPNPPESLRCHTDMDCQRIAGLKNQTCVIKPTDLWGYCTEDWGSLKVITQKIVEATTQITKAPVNPTTQDAQKPTVPSTPSQGETRIRCYINSHCEVVGLSNQHCAIENAQMWGYCS